MKKYYIIFSVICMLVGCQSHPIEPTDKGLPLTSLAAFLTCDEFYGMEVGKIAITDPEQDYFEIPIPYYYPESTDNTTKIYMPAIRVKASLANNCSIYPPLTVLNMNEKNEFTLTDSQGESKKIIITGKRVRSSEAKVMTFDIIKGPMKINGFINEDKKEIYLFTTDDLAGYEAEVTLNSHSSLVTDITTLTDFNGNQSLVVKADDGTEYTYTIIKKYPTKIPYGIRETSVVNLFHLDPVKLLGFPAHTSVVHPSMGYVDGNLVMSFANGSKPIYLDPLTGTKKGEINTGNVDIASVTSDEGGNLLMFTYAEAAGVCEIYTSRSVNDAPKSFYSFTNEMDVPVGYHTRVHGNIDTDAVIILTHEGVAGVTETSKVVRIVVNNRQVTSISTLDLASNGMSWAEVTRNTPKVCASSSRSDSGLFLAYYSDNTLHYLDSALELKGSQALSNFGVTTNNNTGTMDVKTFNNAIYLANLCGTYFTYSLPSLRVFDLTNSTAISSAKPILANDGLTRYQEGTQGVSASEVLLAPTADGFKVFIFYYDHNSSVLGAYSADCIDL